MGVLIHPPEREEKLEGVMSDMSEERTPWVPRASLRRFAGCGEASSMGASGAFSFVILASPCIQ